jgi:hypothetical protein
MRKIIPGLLLLVLICTVQAQTPSVHPTFRLKLIEATQDVDAMNDPTSSQIEEAMNRVQARKSGQELGRIAQTPLETNIAAQVSEYREGIRTCVFARGTNTLDESRTCFEDARKGRAIALKLAGLEATSVYPHSPRTN